MFKKWFVIPVVVLMLGLPISIHAQDTPTPDVIGDPVVIEVTTPTPAPTAIIVEPPPPDPVVEEPGDPPATTPENLLGQIFQLLKDATFMAWSAAGVIVIVGTLKTLAGIIGWRIEDTGAVFLTLIVQVLIWLAYAFANYFNQGEAFQAWYLKIIDVVRALLPLFGAVFLGHLGYQAAAKRKIPVLGYKAPPKPAR